MTYYTIPYKQDGSCCPVCGLPSDPCNCPEEGKWYCLQVAYTGFADPDGKCPPIYCFPWPTLNPAQVPQPFALCAQLSDAVAAALPGCVPGSAFTPPQVSGCYWTEIIDGPFDTSDGCVLNNCPKWYCMKVEEFEGGTQCNVPNGNPPSYFCVQLVPWMAQTQYPQCQDGASTGYKRTIISGPYDTETECSVQCGQCCAADVMYAGKTLTVHETSRSLDYNYGYKVTRTFTGTYVGGGNFSGSWAPYDEYESSDFDPIPNYCAFDNIPLSVHVPETPATISVVCRNPNDDATRWYDLVIYGSSMVSLFRFYASQPGCTGAFGACYTQGGTSARGRCSGRFSSSCFHWSGTFETCTEHYWDNLSCQGAVTYVDMGTRTLTATIA